MLVNYVIELFVFSVEDLFFVVIVLVIFLFVVNIVLSFVCIDTLSLIFVFPILLPFTIKLFKNVLNLPFELLIALLHNILKCLWHPQLFGFFSKLLPSKDGIESAVNISSDLKIIMFD